MPEAELARNPVRPRCVSFTRRVSIGELETRGAKMLDPKKAYSGFAVDDVQKAREFYEGTVGLTASFVSHTASIRQHKEGTPQRHRRSSGSRRRGVGSCVSERDAPVRRASPRLG